MFVHYVSDGDEAAGSFLIQLAAGRELCIDDAIYGGDQTYPRLVSGYPTIPTGTILDSGDVAISCEGGRAAQ